uniref:Uncharacterized protein n=1 Tax=Sphaerodactylus townsendi TaxID=933632 RepID=A0ACB8FPF0_9SAUR
MACWSPATRTLQRSPLRTDCPKANTPERNASLPHVPTEDTNHTCDNNRPEPAGTARHGRCFSLPTKTTCCDPLTQPDATGALFHPREGRRQGIGAHPAPRERASAEYTSRRPRQRQQQQSRVCWAGSARPACSAYVKIPKLRFVLLIVFAERH